MYVRRGVGPSAPIHSSLSHSFAFSTLGSILLRLMPVLWFSSRSHVKVGVRGASVAKPCSRVTRGTWSIVAGPCVLSDFMFSKLGEILAAMPSDPSDWMPPKFHDYYCYNLKFHLTSLNKRHFLP